MIKRIALLTLILFSVVWSAGNDLYRFQIHFDTGSYTLKESDTAALEDFASYLKSHPSVTVEIQGHTDSIGDEDKNLKLSELRAQAVADALVQYGVDSNRLRVQGYGETQPIASNDTEEGKYENRRVEAHLQGLEKQKKSQSVLEGTILDATSSSPISVATVQLFEADTLVSFATTDENGKFAISAKPGHYLLTIDREGSVSKNLPVTIDKQGKTELPPVYLATDLSALSAPAVHFTQNKVNSDKSKTDLTLTVTDMGSGVGKIVFYNNGVRINPQLISTNKEGNRYIYRYRIGTPVGVSEITAVVYDKSNSVQSAPAKIRVTADYKVKPILHALVIGIDRFENQKLNLNYTDDDAELMREVLNRYSSNLFDDVQVTYLVGASNTTRKNILAKLKEMKKRVAPNDYFVFYVSSHGYMDTRHNKYYLVPSDVGDMSHLISEYELKALMADIDTRYKLVLFDTCHSGKATEAIAKKLMQDKNADVTTISASKTTQVAMEGYRGHGVFTYILAEGLKGAADTDQNKRIDSIEIAHYIEKYLPTISVQRFHKEQDAVVNYTPRSFDVTLLDKRYRPAQIVPVEFKKEELPQLLHNLDTQNVAAIHNFYAEHKVEPSVVETTVPKPKPKPKKRKKANKKYKAPLFNIGIGGAFGTGAAGKIFAEIRPSDTFALYVNASKTYLAEMSINGHDMPANNMDAIGVALRYTGFVIGYDKILSHKSDNRDKYTKKAKSAFMIGLRDGGEKRLGVGFYYKQYDSKDIYGDDMFSLMLELTYKIF